MRGFLTCTYRLRGKTHEVYDTPRVGQRKIEIDDELYFGLASRSGTRATRTRTNIVMITITSIITMAIAITMYHYCYSYYGYDYYYHSYYCY